MSAARVLLMRLSIRTSSKGTEYLSGYLGLARVVAFKAKEPDKFGNEQWELYVAEPEPKREQAEPAPGAQRSDLPVRGQGTWDRARDVTGGDLPTGETREYRNDRRDPREEHIRELADRFQPDEDIPF